MRKRKIINSILDGNTYFDSEELWAKFEDSVVPLSDGHFYCTYRGELYEVVISGISMTITRDEELIGGISFIFKERTISNFYKMEWVRETVLKDAFREVECFK